MSSLSAPPVSKRTENTMSRQKNLSTLVKDEKVRIQMVPGRYVLKPRGKTPVQLKEGGWTEIGVETIAIETEGDHRMGMYTRLYDESDPKDAEILRLLRAELQEKPHLATHVDYQIKIVGEFSESEPWPGYDDQNAEQIAAYWAAMPDRAKDQHRLEDIMKHELTRVDEDGNDLSDKAKIDVLNKLHREREAAEKDAAEETVAL